MPFVNNIGDIVHTMTHRFMGSANKNIGDAFLLVWKYDDDKIEISANNELKFLDEKYSEILCDFALISFMKLQAKVNREPKIL